jgi:glycerophosphoryl diester phosphodiesterase
MLRRVAGVRAVQQAHELSIRVHTWTVNHPRTIKRCADIGVDAVITDVPAVARRVLSRS